MRPQATCVLCGRSRPFPTLYERSGFTLVRCPSCRLVFQDPQPDEADLAGAYYFDGDFVATLEDELRPVVLARAAEKLELLRAAGLPERGRALDVGCSTGAWLETATGAGWEAEGVEIGEAPAEAARARGLTVHTGTLADAPVHGPYDLITFWDVLEHLPEPLAALERARSLLAPGGLVALTFPNVAGWYPRVTYRLLARTTGVWEHPELPVHLFDFSPATARGLVEKAGLRVAASHTTEIPFAFLRSAPLRDQLEPAPRRRAVLMPLFAVLRALIYPPARWADRSNAQFVLAGYEARPTTAMVSP